MSTNSVIDQTGTLEKTKKKPFRNWRSTGQIIYAFLVLGFALDSLQRMNKSFASDPYKINFIETWLTWLSTLCFGLGWLITHWVESALSKNQTKLAKVLFSGIFAILIFILIFLGFVSDDDVLHSFAMPAQFLIFSGFFLRFATFHPDNLRRMDKKYLDNPIITIDKNVIYAKYLFTSFKTPTSNISNIETKTEYLDNFVFTPPHQYEYIHFHIPVLRFITIFGFRFGSKLINGFRLDGLDNAQKEDLRTSLIVGQS